MFVNDDRMQAKPDLDHILLSKGKVPLTPLLALLTLFQHLPKIVLEVSRDIGSGTLPIGGPATVHQTFQVSFLFRAQNLALYCVIQSAEAGNLFNEYMLARVFNVIRPILQQSPIIDVY